MKKLLCAMLALTLALGCLPALAEAPDVVATIFPLYDWTRRVMEGVGEPTLLLGSGVDLHSYQPTAQDIVRLSGCDVLIYVGGESDEWVEDALKEAVNPNQLALNLMDALDDLAEEELVEGMQAEPEADGGAEYDEHIWLSLRNAKALVAAIADALCDADPEHAEAYRANAAAYSEELDALDRSYADAVAAAPLNALLFGDRFPFRYLVDDYGLSYYAAFSGCSAETEASFETIVFLAGKVDELGLPAVLTIDGGDGRVAATIAQAAKADPAILAMDSMQSTTAVDAQAGASYLGIMEENLAVLRAALGE